MISIIIPFYNEDGNLPILLEGITAQMTKLKKSYEIIFVNDGSVDDSIIKLKSKIDSLHLKVGIVKILNHKKKLGKGKSLLKGIREARGDVIVFMDGDNQDDPIDLPKFIKRIDEGYDFVNGIRINRQDNGLVKMYSGFVSKFLRSYMDSPYHDINCGFKAFKKEVLTDFAFYGNNFRFFPLTVYHSGFKVTEIEVNNKKRLYGVTKFGSNKLLIGIFDTVTAYFLYKFSEKPLHFFGSIGILLFLFGFFITAYLTFMRIFYHQMLYRRPMLLFGILLIIVGIQLGLTGMIGELIVFLNKRKT